jgi:hypothetical protein
VKTAPKFENGTPKALFDLRAVPNSAVGLSFRYDVAPDGNRFVVNTLSGGSEGAAAAPITVVLNWIASVRK